jgi:hypothetical protein
MEGYIVKAQAGDSYITETGSGFAWNSGKHAFVEAHVFLDEGEAERIAKQFGGRVLFHD